MAYQPAAMLVCKVLSSAFRPSSTSRLTVSLSTSTGGAGSAGERPGEKPASAACPGAGETGDAIRIRWPLFQGMRPGANLPGLWVPPAGLAACLARTPSLAVRRASPFAPDAVPVLPAPGTGAEAGAGEAGCEFGSIGTRGELTVRW